MKKTDIARLVETSVRKEAYSAEIRDVLMALSGGADSVATAFALKKTGINLTALHCNFHLRGEESDRDMKFVEEFCKNHEIPLLIKEFDVPGHIEKHKSVSVEMACRDLRHSWFREVLEESDAQRIATGHNADDNIETFFLNAFRGSGTRGLSAMTPDNGTIWRPLLNFHRCQILEYLSVYDLSYIVDSTNLSNDYRRNYLRNTIIPLLKQEWKGFDKAMLSTLSSLASENKIVESSIIEMLPPEGKPLSSETILNFPAPLLLIKRFIDPAGPFSTTPSEILAAVKANKPHIRRWRLKNGNVFLRNRLLFVEISNG